MLICSIEIRVETSLNVPFLCCFSVLITRPAGDQRTKVQDLEGRYDHRQSRSAGNVVQNRTRKTCSHRLEDEVTVHDEKSVRHDGSLRFGFR